jgi:CelD/BcsL family acetyltransferase involved in cellulose biosynthesis
MLSIDLIERDSEFDALEGAWTSLLEQCEDVTVFQTFAWNRAYWQTRQGRERLRILVLRDDRRVTGIAPLICGGVWQNRIPFRKLDILGHGPSDRLNFLFPDRQEDHVQCLLDYVFEHSDGWSVFMVRDFVEESPIAVALLRVIKGRNYSYLRLSAEKLPYVEMQRTWEDYYTERFSSKQRARDRALKRKLEKLGTVEARLIDDLSEEPQLIERFLAMPHHDADRGRLYRIPFANPVNARFFKELTQALANNGMLRTYLLELSGELIAYSFGFKFRRSAYDYFSSFNPAYGNCGPGRILLNTNLRDCHERGIGMYHFLRGSEEYKFRWANGIHRNLSILVFPPSASGALLRWMYRIRNHGGTDAHDTLKERP